MIAGLSKRLSEDCATRGADRLRANCRENLPMIRACPGVRDLAGILAGVPVVVAAAGPSLDEAIPILAMRRPLVIALDRAARPLLEAGITPDWIVGVEHSPLGAEKMRGLKGLEKIPFVFHPCIHPDTLRLYPGPLYTFDFPDLVLGKGAIELGTGVITHAVGLAKVMGADPVILAGADLGYPDGERTHATGVTQIWHPGLPDHLDLPSTDGGLIMSDSFMAAFVEELSTQFSGNYIQTSPRGAIIPGWKHEHLENVL